jgi:tetratricopeptide (TPR) repeat protein
VLNLAQFLLQQGVPMKGANLLEQGMKSGLLAKNYKNTRLLATCLVHGRAFERAFEPLARAAKMADEGDLYIQLAQLRMAREEWSKAAEAVEAALAKGNLTDEANAHLLLGIVYFSSDKKIAARRAFERAIRFASTKKAATQWLRSLEKRQ